MGNRLRQLGGRPRDRRSCARGFTLLEVMISLGILAVALLAIGDLNGGAVRTHAYARSLTTAVQLARGKMLDFQAQLRKEGLSDFSKEYRGDFERDGFPDYRWTAQVVKPEIDVDPTQLLEMAAGGLGLGAGGSPGMPAENPLVSGPFGAMASTMIQQLMETLKSSVREVKLTITWKNGRREESFDLVEHVVILPDAQKKAVENATPVGTPGAPAMPAPAGLGGAAGAPGTPNPFGFNPGGGFVPQPPGGAR